MLPLLLPPRPKSKHRGGNDAPNARAAPRPAEHRAIRDRRATPRLRVELECEESHGGSRCVRVTTDLSTFGMSTRHGPTPAQGSRLWLKLFLPDEPGAPLELQASVLGRYDAGGGMRLKFVKPSLEAVRRIHRFLVRSH